MNIDATVRTEPHGGNPWPAMQVPLWALLSGGGIASAMLVPFAAEALCALLAAVILVAQPRLALGALALAAWIKVRNPYLLGEHPIPVLAGWLPILAAIARAALQPWATLQSRGVLWIMAFAAIAGSRVLANPAMLALSIPKLLVFSGGLVAMLALVRTANLPRSGAAGISGHDVVNTLFLVTTCLCVPLLATPAIGYLLNQSGFQGVTSQPQAFAVLFAPLVAYYVMRTVETESLALTRWCMALAGITLLVFSQSRTGVAAALGGIGLGLFVWWRNKRAARGFGPGFWLRASCGVLLLAALGYLFRVEILEAATEFVLKGVEGELDTESLLTSRAVLFATVWQSFLSQPVLGIGFGVPTLPDELQMTTSSTFGVVLSASIEKGNGFLQVLEETGVVGAAVMGGFLVALGRAGGLARNAAAMALVAAALATNVGEAIIYSLGGVGLAQWAYVMLGLTLLQAPAPRAASDMNPPPPCAA